MHRGVKMLFVKIHCFPLHCPIINEHSLYMAKQPALYFIGGTHLYILYSTYIVNIGFLFWKVNSKKYMTQLYSKTNLFIF